MNVAKSHLVGRDDELRILLGHLTDVSSRGCAVGLLGEPGVGKTALQAEVLTRAGSLAFTVLTARGQPV